jgi:hypothetical protein
LRTLRQTVLQIQIAVKTDNDEVAMAVLTTFWLFWKFVRLTGSKIKLFFTNQKSDLVRAWLIFQIIIVSIAFVFGLNITFAK